LPNPSTKIQSPKWEKWERALWSISTCSEKLRGVSLPSFLSHGESGPATLVVLRIGGEHPHGLTLLCLEADLSAIEMADQAVGLVRGLDDIRFVNHEWDISSDPTGPLVCLPVDEI